MSNPRPVAFPLLKLGLAGHGPCNKRFADGGKMHHVREAGRSNDASLDVSPRFPSTGPQTFAANIAFVGFGGSGLGNWHVDYLAVCVIGAGAGFLLHQCYGGFKPCGGSRAAKSWRVEGGAPSEKMERIPEDKSFGAGLGRREARSGRIV